jgi:hypothetical protein
MLLVRKSKTQVSDNSLCEAVGHQALSLLWGLIMHRLCGGGCGDMGQVHRCTNL